MIQEAQTEQKEVVYDRKRAVPDGSIGSTATLTSNLGELTAVATSPIMSVPTTSMTPATPDPIAELKKQLSQLTLLLQGQARTSGVKAIEVPTVSSVLSIRADRVSRCPYCDSTEHARRECTSLTEDLRLGLVKLNEKGRVINAITGEEIPLMYGADGIKRIVDMVRPKVLPPMPTLTSANANGRAITFDDSAFDRLGDNSIRVTTLELFS